VITPGTIKIRRLTESDIEELRNFHRRREDIQQPEVADRIVQLIEWFAFSYPLSRGEAAYYVAEENGKIIATLGRLPTEFSVNGKYLKGYYIHNLHVDVGSRREGLGFDLVMSLSQKVEDESEYFFCMFALSPINYRMQKRRKYVVLPPAPMYFRPVTTYQQVRAIVRNRLLARVISPFAEMTLNLADLLLFSFSRSDGDVMSIERFDSRFDEFNRKILPRVGVSTVKSSTYLNWKYIDRPFRTEKVLAVERNGELKGFVVLSVFPFKKKFRRGWIVEILADPDDIPAISALCKASIRYFKNAKVDTVQCILTDERFTRVLKKFMFRKGSGVGEPVLLGNLDKCQSEKDYLSEIRNWHFTYGERASYFLKPELLTTVRAKSANRESL